jgi:hypothetical protein
MEACDGARDGDKIRWLEGPSTNCYYARKLGNSLKRAGESLKLQDVGQYVGSGTVVSDFY